METNPGQRTDRGRVIAVVAAFLLIAVPGLWWIDQAALPGSIDGGWMMSLTDAAAHGEISGRDVYSTYGLGFQGIGWLARKLHVADSSYDSLILLAALMVVFGALFFALTLHLLRALDAFGILLATLIISVLGLPQPAWVRPAALLLVVVWTAGPRSEDGDGNRLSRGGRWLLGGAMASAVQLLSFDYGVFAILTLIGAGGFEALLRVKLLGSRAALRLGFERAGAVLAGAGALLVLLCLIYATGPGGLFEYPRVLWEMSNGYAATLGSPWEGGGSWMAALAAMVAFLVVSPLVQRRRGSETGSSPYPPYPWVLLVAGLVCLRGATTRSDVNHISLALVPLLFAFLVVALDRAATRALRIPAMLITAALLATWPGGGFGRLGRAFLVVVRPFELTERWEVLRTWNTSSGLYLPAVLRAGDRSVPLMVFPLVNQFGVVAGRRLFMPFVQPYQATTARLDRLYAARLLEYPGALEVLYQFDGVAVGELDGVGAITRNPAVFETLWRSFPAVAPAAEGHVLLRRRAPREAAPELPRSPLRVLEQTPLAVGSNQGLASFESAACSLLRIGWSVEYPWTRILGRSSAWWVEVFLGDRKVAGGAVVALDSPRFETYLSLMAPDAFSGVFFGSAPRTQFDRIRFTLKDGTFLAARPRHLAIDSVDCVNP